MALIAEELVQEWLNRQGYFTIRGARLGNHELDLPAIKVKEDGSLHCRHIEVNVSVNPIGYMGPERSARRQRVDEQHENARKWVKAKLHASGKLELRELLAPGQPWSLEVVLHKLRGPDQLTAIRSEGVKTLRLSDVISDLGNPVKELGQMLKAASGQSLSDLLSAGESSSAP